MARSITRHRTLCFQLACFLVLATVVRAGDPNTAGPVKPVTTTTVSRIAAENQPPEFTPEESASFERGAAAFNQLCHVCHGQDGKGAPILDDPDGRLMAPPLSGSIRVMGRPEYVITALLCGITGPIDGEIYQGLMVSMGSYDDGWIADVASYIRNDFDNAGSMITSNQVTRIRARIGNRAEPFTIPELLSTLPAGLSNQALWKVTASHNPQSARNAIDGASKATAWIAESAKSEGMWFEIELPAPVSICEINLDSIAGEAGAAPGIPTGCKVQFSMDERKWGDAITEIQRRGPATAFIMDPIRAKTIRITSTAAADTARWSISRIQLFQAGQPIPEATRKPRVNDYE